MTGKSSSTNNSTEDCALIDMLGAIGADHMKVRTSIDVESLYFDNGGSKYSRQNLVKNVDDEIVAL